MPKIGLIGMAIFCLQVTCVPAFAGDFDGSKPLFGTLIEIIEINTSRTIKDVDPDSVGVPRFFIIDFKKKIIRPTSGPVVFNRRVTPILSLRLIFEPHLPDRPISGWDDRSPADRLRFE